jgi:transposase
LHNAIRLVFAGKGGSLINPSNLRQRSFASLLESAGLPQITFHDLRYTCASLLFQKNGHLKRLAIRLGLTHHRCMNAYSEDLRKKVVEAKECGMPTVEVARTFGVGISSVKRYAKTAREGGSLRPKKSPGRPPKADERARRLLEADLQERPAATLSERREYLSSVAGLRVSESTVSRLLRRMGWSRKKDRWVRQNATSS